MQELFFGECLFEFRANVSLTNKNFVTNPLALDRVEPSNGSQCRGLLFPLPFWPKRYLEPQVGGIKIVGNCLQTIHFLSWAAHSQFDL